MFIRFGQHDVPVPGPPGTALPELIRNGRTHTGVGSPARTRWLFPGGLPGKPITASQLGERLRTLGIHAMPGRRAALAALAARLPAAVLADLLQPSPGTAVRWMREAGGHWSRCAAELARERVHRTCRMPPATAPGRGIRQGRNTAGYQYPGGCAGACRLAAPRPSSPMVTLTVYAHVMPGNQCDAADTFARLAGEASGA